MARKSKQLLLIPEAREELEEYYKHDSNHSFRDRCKMILLKSEGYTSKQIAAILGTNNISVHNWLKRYRDSGLEALKTKPGQGRKPILEEAHLGIVRAVVEQERQRLSQARQIIEENIGKKMSNMTLTRFLKVITALTNE